MRKVRIIISIAAFVLLTLTLLGVVRVTWLARVQVVPALMAGSATILVGLFLLTWATGRSYCSLLCPLGVVQDVVRRIAMRRRPPSAEGGGSVPSPAQTHPRRRGVTTVIRYAVLAAAIVGYIGGLFYLPALLDPYSAYARMVHHLLRPVWGVLKNAVAVGNDWTGWGILREEYVAEGWVAPCVAAVTLVAVTLAAWWGGRLWCNTLCPVGTLLGLISRWSWLKIRVDSSRCAQCHGGCTVRCKASCFDLAQGRVDAARCVVCFDCIEQCRGQALSYGRPVAKRPDNVDADRRRFLTTTATMAIAMPAAWAQHVIYKTTSGPRWEKKIRTMMGSQVAAERYWAIMPPGTVARDRFQSLCTSCHLCIAHCPQHVLKPATTVEYGWSGILQPTMSFEEGWCRPDCNLCGQVCPTQAIRPLTVEQKRHDRLGWANFNSRTCITQTDDVDCGLCATHCPERAIRLVEKNGHKVPQVIVSRCIGCGACEYYCPARPKAIYVEGLMY